MPEFISSVRLIADWGLLVLIWIVQLIIYPSFRHIDPNRFVQWHHEYMRRISFIVMPLMLTQAACLGFVLISEGMTLPNGIALVAVLTAWAVTFTCSVPCHNKLQELGNETEWVDRIINTNWVRTIAWTIAALPSLFI